jgi:putative ATP-binding cassette transporter
MSPSNKRMLVKELSLTIPHGVSVLVTGDDAARDALIKAIAGIYDAGVGLIKRPPLDRILFLPDRPYIPPGTLRQALAPVHGGRLLTDERVQEMSSLLDLDELIVRAGGLDVEHDWDTLLSAPEQRRVSFARILIANPSFVVMANPGRDVEMTIRRRLFQLLKEHGITPIIFGLAGKRDIDERPSNYDAVLNLGEEGRWRWRKTR